jgi:hypothetical protein
MKNSMRALVLVAVASGAAGVAVACSSSSSDGSSGGTGTDSGPGADTSTTPSDAGTDTSLSPTDAATDSALCPAYTGALPGDAGAQCHDLVSSAPSVVVTVDPGTLPVGTGGVLSDGLYYLTEARIYPGSPVPAGTTLKYAVLVAGDKSYVVDDNGATTVRRTTTKNPDGGAGIVVCETKVDNNNGVTTNTATCNSLITFDSTSKFSAKFAKQ